jgi:N-formylmaleamate deformylase
MSTPRDPQINLLNDPLNQLPNHPNRVPMRDWPQFRALVNERSLRYFRSGGDHPALVLVHGFTDNALYYSALAEVLSEDYDVVAYDCRGHGASDRALGSFSDDDRANDLLGLVGALSLDRPVVIGHSMGGSTIGRAIVKQPGFCRGAIFEDPAWWERPPAATEAEEQQHIEIGRSRNAAWQSSIASLQAGTWDDGLALRRSEEPKWSDSDLSLSLAARFEVELDLFTYFPTAQAEWHSVVEKIACPALLMIGENERGGIISVASAEEAASISPLLQWHQVLGAGHAIRYDQPTEFLAVVTAFLRHLPHNTAA